MESLGEEQDRDGNRVEQGINVFGNKGSTDQHAYVQQLRDGINNFFVAFFRVLESGVKSIEVEPQIRSGDYLNGLLIGRIAALFYNERGSLTLSHPLLSARSLPSLIHLLD